MPANRDVLALSDALPAGKRDPLWMVGKRDPLPIAGKRDPLSIAGKRDMLERFVKGDPRVLDGADPLIISARIASKKEVPVVLSKIEVPSVIRDPFASRDEFWPGRISCAPQPRPAWKACIWDRLTWPMRVKPPRPAPAADMEGRVVVVQLLFGSVEDGSRAKMGG